MKIFIFVIIICPLVFTLETTGAFAAQKAQNKLRNSERKPDKLFYGEQNKPILYTRANITLIRKTLPPPAPLPEPLPWQEKIVRPEPEIPEKQPIPPYPPLVLDVEIRDGMALYNQNGWFNLSSYSEKSGVMMAFSEPGVHPIIRSAQYARTDILFIDKQGKITQIAPSILLSELDQDIYPSAPVLAFLFMKGGTCEELAINVGDEIRYSLFKKPPVILNAPKENTTNTLSPSPVKID